MPTGVANAQGRGREGCPRGYLRTGHLISTPCVLPLPIHPALHLMAPRPTQTFSLIGGSVPHFRAEILAKDLL